MVEDPLSQAVDRSRVRGGVLLSMRLLAVVAATACGGAPVPPAATTAPPPPESVAIGDAGVPPQSVTIAGARIRGLRGTLNHDDVVQAMEARAPALQACIEQGRRQQKRVNGDIEFAFKVDAEGKPVDVRATRSDIGHEALEACLTGVLAQTAFPAPAGRTVTRDLSWSTGVDSAYRPAEPMDPALLEPVLETHRAETREACETKRRFRYELTVYSNRRGRVLSAGAFVARGGKTARALQPCLLEQVRAWKLPRSKKRLNKVSFTL